MAKISKAPKSKVASNWFPAIAALALTLAIGQEQKVWAADQADLIVSNARVFTGSYLAGKAGSSDVPQLASCLACAGGKIIYVADARGIAALKGPQTKELNLGGELVLPGFHDCHVHLCEGGI